MIFCCGVARRSCYWLWLRGVGSIKFTQCGKTSEFATSAKDAKTAAAGALRRGSAVLRASKKDSEADDVEGDEIGHHGGSSS
jgi:hypothetical protein